MRTNGRRWSGGRYIGDGWLGFGEWARDIYARGVFDVALKNMGHLSYARGGNVTLMFWKINASLFQCFIFMGYRRDCFIARVRRQVACKGFCKYVFNFGVHYSFMQFNIEIV